MNEKDLLGSVIDAARRTGWKVAHFRSVPVKYPGSPIRWMTPVQADGKGFPDLLMVRERILAVEIKGGGNKPEPEQASWMSAFRIAGARAFVWTPDDWEDNVLAELTLRKRSDAALDDDNRPSLSATAAALR